MEVGFDRLNEIFSDSTAVHELAPGLYTALPEETWRAPYDRRAAGYDAILRWSIYHRVFWGTSILAHRRFANASLHAAGDGPFAEIGCGSLLFTAPMYQRSRAGPTLLVDRSLRMLRRGIKRLGSSGRGVPNGIVTLHADAGALPVRTGIFSSILSLNLLHVPCDRPAIISEFSRILVPGRGRLFVSSLVRSGRWSDAYLGMLHRAGEFGPPLTLEEHREKVAGRWGVVESTRTEGNMSFLLVRHAG
jgi:SAM-dependent methyltransferase